MTADPGFPEDFRQHAFDRFSRAEVSRTTAGSGLGLYLVLAVAEAHQGSAEVLDGPGGAVRLTVLTSDLPSYPLDHRTELHGRGASGLHHRGGSSPTYADAMVLFG